MGCVEPPPYFCAATEMAWDIVEQYAQTQIGSLPCHKLIVWLEAGEVYKNLINHCRITLVTFYYLFELNVDDFVVLVWGQSKDSIHHITLGLMMGINDVFPEDTDDCNNPASLEKLKKGDGTLV